MEIRLIWAQGPNGELGAEGALPWHIPGDLQRFKAATQGGAVLMGRTTWESLPRKPLSDRDNLVLSRSARELPGAKVFQNQWDALEYARHHHDKLWIIGGATVYEAFLHMAQSAIVTHIPRAAPNADAFAPRIPSSWPATLLEEFDADGMKCRVVHYSNPRALLLANF